MVEPAKGSTTWQKPNLPRDRRSLGTAHAILTVRVAACFLEPHSARFTAVRVVPIVAADYMPEPFMLGDQFQGPWRHSQLMTAKAVKDFSAWRRPSALPLTSPVCPRAAGCRSPTRPAPRRTAAPRAPTTEVA